MKTYHVVPSREGICGEQLPEGFLQVFIHGDPHGM